MLSALTRRSTLQLLAAGTALLPMMARAQAAPVARLLILSDLHSAYERSAQLLAALRAEVAANGVPHAILINGDMFELGNTVAVRSDGAIDMALLAELAKLAPTVLNLGNHEPDLVGDMAQIVAQARALGITVLSNIHDARSGQLFAPASAVLELSGLQVKLAALGTPALNTYPKDLRETLAIPDPVEWAATHLGAIFAGPGLNVLLSHAGVVADRAILPTLPDGSLLVGGHDHLLFTHEQGRTRYVHTGSWSAAYSVAEIAADGAIGVTQVAVDLAGPVDADLAALIATTLAKHLSEEEQAVVATVPAALSLAETARLVAGAMARAAEADIGFVGHTTFGTGMPAGAMNRYTWNSVVRFDGKLVVTEVPAATLRAILAITDQDRAERLEQRTGDFLYSAPDGLPEKDSYRIVTGDWPAFNQKAYFQREDLAFVDGPEVKIKQLVLDALNKG